jgi:ribosomal protein S11
MRKFKAGPIGVKNCAKTLPTFILTKKFYIHSKVGNTSNNNTIITINDEFGHIPCARQ